MPMNRCALAGKELAKCRWKKHNKKKGVAKAKASHAQIKAKKAAKLKPVQDAQKKKNKAMQKKLKKAGKIPKKKKQPQVADIF